MTEEKKSENKRGEFEKVIHETASGQPNEGNEVIKYINATPNEGNIYSGLGKPSNIPKESKSKASETNSE